MVSTTAIQSRTSLTANNGNCLLYTSVREVAEKFGYEPIRFLMLQAHYRSQINYNVEIIEQCIAALERLYNCRNNLEYALGNAQSGAFDEEQKNALLARKQQFIDAMENDLNTADAISALFELVRDCNTITSGNTLGSKEHIAFAKGIFDELCGVLGLLYQKKDDEIPQEVLDLVEQRKACLLYTSWQQKRQKLQSRWMNPA